MLSYLPESGELFSVLLQPRSLLLFSDLMYSEYLHGIHDVNFDVIGLNVTRTNAKDVSQILEDRQKVEDLILFNNAYHLPCINAQLAQVEYGDVIYRSVRNSLTFRQMLA